ncbi:hypothetical protein B0H17DRAFT_934044, partial [Mycena rosella]
RYSKGNVAIFAQYVGTVGSLLPPPREEIAEAMCALFIGSETVPTRDNIKKLGPVLVSKTRVQTILDFLLKENAYYVASGTTFSQSNFDNMLGSEWDGMDAGIPSGIELGCLPDAYTGPTYSFDSSLGH